MDTQVQNAAEQRAAIVAQIAAMREEQKAQKEALKAQREEATAKLKAQRDELKAAREAAKAESAAKREAAKAERDAKASENSAAKLAAEQEKLTKRAAREAAKLEKEKEKLAKLQAKLENPRVEQNGVLRPNSGTKCGAAWDLFDSKSSEKGAPVAVKEVLDEASAQGLSEGNVRAEYSRWRRFHGIVGRVAA